MTPTACSRCGQHHPTGKGRPCPAANRFWVKVDKHGLVPEHRPDLGPCWIWTAHHDPHGYGRFGIEGSTTMLAHRFAYGLLVGLIPIGYEIDHLCRVPACVNPAHLEPVQHRENLLRGVGPSAVHSRKTHCHRGHPFTPDNTYVRPDGSRLCRACRVARGEIKGAGS